MAGYKSTLIDDDAVSLWTFDGDAFDSGSHKLLVPIGEPNMIIDEIDNLNPAILHNDNETYLGYRLGMASLIAYEQTDQYSMSFGYAGKQPGHPNQWAKAYLEVPHTISYAFPRLGTFSVELVFYKQFSSDEGAGRSDYTRPIIMKNGVFEIYFTFPYSTYSQVAVKHPGGTLSVPIAFKPGYNLVGNTTHFVFVWEVTQGANASYTGTAKIYINGFLGASASFNYFDVFPNTNVDSPILIGGRVGSDIRYDYHTSNFQIDQVAIYDRALTPDQIANHFSKIFPYDEMIKRTFVSNFWPLDDADSTIDSTVHPSVGNLDGSYIGTRGYHYIRGVDGPSNLMGSKATLFDNGGMATFLNINYYHSYIPRLINTEYSYEIWFASSATRRAIIIAAQELAWPFAGPLLQLNMRDHQEMSGSVQFTESENDKVFNSKFLTDNGTRFNFNDGNWHHVVFLRRPEGMVEFWLDGVLHDSLVTSTKTVGQPGQLLIMNSMPGKLHFSGTVCKLAYYPYALQDSQIRMHHSYAVTYRIRGVVTLLGVPYQAVLRFYKSSTGELVKELTSDPNSGEYDAVFYDNSNIDILVFSKTDLSVRYRAYGPVTPASFLDYPINI